jgi:hypothetical protein
MDWYSSLARLESQPFLKRVKGKTYQTILVKDHSRCLKCCFVLYFLLLYDNLKIVTSLVKTEEKLSSRKSSCQLISLLWPGIMTENLEWLRCLCCCWCRLFIYQGIERKSWEKEKDECVIMIAYFIFTDFFLIYNSVLSLTRQTAESLLQMKHRSVYGCSHCLLQLRCACYGESFLSRPSSFTFDVDPLSLHYVQHFDKKQFK